MQCLSAADIKHWSRDAEVFYTSRDWLICVFAGFIALYVVYVIVVVVGRYIYQKQKRRVLSIRAGRID